MMDLLSLLEELNKKFPMDTFDLTIEAWVNRIRRIEEMQRRIVGHLATPLLVPDIPIELVPGGRMPTKAHESDACFDCYARCHSTQGIQLRGKETLVLPLGFKLTVPEGWKAVIWGRSGLAGRGYWTHVGTIDSGYRNEVGAILHNHTGAHLQIWNEERIAQISLERVHSFKFHLVDRIDEEGDRGGGFGSTGQ